MRKKRWLTAGMAVIAAAAVIMAATSYNCLLYTSPSPRDTR